MLNKRTYQIQVITAGKKFNIRSTTVNTFLKIHFISGQRASQKNHSKYQTNTNQHLIYDFHDENIKTVY